MQIQNAYHVIFSVILSGRHLAFKSIHRLLPNFYRQKICAPFVTFLNITTSSYSAFYVPLSHIFCDKAYHTLLRML